MKVTRMHPFTGKVNTLELDITDEQMERWQNGEMVQDAFPHLSVDEREFLITGLVPGDWDELFKDRDECDASIL